MTIANGRISIHNLAVTPEAVQRLAARTSSGAAPGSHPSVFEDTNGRLAQMREECAHLARLFSESEPEITKAMMAGLDMFANGFLHLAGLVKKAIMDADKETGGRVVYIE